MERLEVPIDLLDREDCVLGNVLAACGILIGSPGLQFVLMRRALLSCPGGMHCPRCARNAPAALPPYCDCPNLSPRFILMGHALRRCMGVRARHLLCVRAGHLLCCPQ